MAPGCVPIAPPSGRNREDVGKHTGSLARPNTNVRPRLFIAGDAGVGVHGAVRGAQVP
jgi:hypothetical protein